MTLCVNLENHVQDDGLHTRMTVEWETVVVSKMASGVFVSFCLLGFGMRVSTPL